MFFQSTALSALAALTLLTQAPIALAAHARSHRHHVRMEHPFDLTVRDAGSVTIPTADFQQLQSEITAFKGWMNQYTDNAKFLDTAAALAQLRQEFEAFDGWMTDFLNNVQGNGPSTLPPIPTTIPLTATPDPTVLSKLSSSAPAAPFTPPVSSTPLSSAASPARIAPSSLAALVGGSPKGNAVAPISSASPTSVAVQELLHSPSSQPSQPATSAPVVPVVPTLVASSSSVSSPVAPVSSSTPASVAPVSSPAPSTGSGSSSGSFNAGSANNLAVYYGQTAATGQQTLAQMCQDSSVDIVIMAFISDFFGAGGYPTLNLGAACNNGPSTAQSAKAATGLLHCPNVAQDITTCQGLGKKVLLSLGGAVGSSALPSSGQADQFATKLWDLFGGGSGEPTDMRPFGSVKVDGFDLDNEDHSTTNYAEFVSSLRTAMKTDTSKTYYISAAPQCVRPDASIPLDAMQSMDFVWVQFYNNAQAGCDVGQPGFVDSLKAWSGDLSAKGAGPKLYIGAPGCPSCAGAGYVDPGTMAGVIKSAQQANVGNLGGVMLWDGPEAKANNDYLASVKQALG